MRKQIEHILLSILVGTSVLLVLTFWLNTNFNFNLFSIQHWHELALIQASGEPIDVRFYISIAVALFIFIICLNIIYRPHLRKIPKQPETNLPVPTKNALPVMKAPSLPPAVQTEPEPQKAEQKSVEPNSERSASIPMTRPPKLNLPKNMAQIVAMQNANQSKNILTSTDKYNDEIAEIFSANSFLVKKNPTIAGFTPNLFAIGVNEIVWIGGVDCAPEKMKPAIQKLESTFKETLEDITITVNAFIIDTVGNIDDSRIKIFHSINELKQYISEHPGAAPVDSDREDFDAYSEYIDTVLTLLYKA